MSIDKKYFEKFIKTTEKAAIGAFPFIGKGNKNAADKGSVDMMRDELNSINMEGVVVIGEGEMDEAPMLYIGEKVGTKKGQKLDIALDPLEGTNFVANNKPNSFSMLAVSEKGNWSQRFVFALLICLFVQLVHLTLSRERMENDFLFLAFFPKTLTLTE